MHGIVLAVVILLLSILLLWLGRLAVIVFRTRRDVKRYRVAQAIVDIYPTGRFHVEFAPHDTVQPIDAVQLCLSHIANTLYVMNTRHPVLEEVLAALLQLSADDGYSDEEYLRQLEHLLETACDSTLTPRKFAPGNSNRFIIHLLRKQNLDFCIVNLGLWHSQSNLARSTIFLYITVARSLDTKHLRLLRRSFVRMMRYFAKRGALIFDNQFAAYEFVQEERTALSIDDDWASEFMPF